MPVSMPDFKDRPCIFPIYQIEYEDSNICNTIRRFFGIRGGQNGHHRIRSQVVPYPPARSPRRLPSAPIAGSTAQKSHATEHRHPGRCSPSVRGDDGVLPETQLYPHPTSRLGQTPGVVESNVPDVLDGQAGLQRGEKSRTPRDPERPPPVDRQAEDRLV